MTDNDACMSLGADSDDAPESDECSALSWESCADCLLWGRRELGCTCEKAAGDAASPMKQYKVTLLPASTKQPPRTLADMFPKLQLARARAKR